ncbi:monofunctional biosynthetic peptidoglycan transglycosylase [Corticibacter populi]|uniref:Biosynthetic peptidoglycan transglycosylase n=1 Tax=Corticibacter populi TaxID=1550736 RepID=A0A3M6QJ83_9BURK|nr:monofunctional biosynthetic peptidoglycan transglycosylase [Corticibacter populi]RMX02569.1 monofunctional biosynthetic peptidoglycan transglycosylase [Corticibacter populi]RZS33021.1 monofunctional biosynthetic peptidoglycan transglycosylase [Corticibacter populi]
MTGGGRSARSLPAAAGRWLVMVLLAVLSLQLFLLASIATLRWWQPPSTSFQRTAIWENLRDGRAIRWQHQNVAADAIADHARRAVVASEDSLFFAHRGADWQAIERAWQRNTRSEEDARIHGGSTITQQLAKNLFLSSERSLLRKGQELVLAWMLEWTLPKERILDIYLNQVEWGDGIYGIQAAARHYFKTGAARLGAEQAARLAVMLPQPRRLGQNPYSPYMQQRTRTIAARMGAVQIPAAQQD